MSVILLNLKRCFVALTLVLLLSSCDPFSQPQSLMDEYLVRLARVLDVNPQQTEKITPAIWPRVRERRVDIPEIEINMLEFLDLYGCDLQVVVGERNAILGRVMQPLNRLRYSLRFIHEAENCIASTDDQDLTATLQAAVFEKRQQLAAEIWQAGWASEEMANLFSHTASPIALGKPVSASRQLADDFNYLNQTIDKLTAKQDAAELRRWGEIQQRWQYQQDLGALIKSARQLTLMLNAGSELLKQRIEQKPLCYQAKPNPRARQMQGMFFNVYIGHVQPYLATVSQHRDTVMPQVRQFAEKQAAIAPAKVQNYWQLYLTDAPGSVWSDFDTALKNHTRHWQDLLDQCGLRPKAARPAQSRGEAD